MAFILAASGFTFVESLKEFSIRFPQIPTCVDRDLEKVFICHNCVVPNFKNADLYDGFDYDYLKNDFYRKISSVNLSAVETGFIFDKIYNHFNSLATTYILKNCFLFYNWGINSFEIISNHKEINEKIIQFNNRLPKLKETNFPGDHNKRIMATTKNYNKDKCFQQPTLPKSVKIAFKNAVPFFDLPQNPDCPTQEMFDLNSILYNSKQQPQWPKNHILSVMNVDKLLLFIIDLPKTNRKLSEKLKNDCEDWFAIRHILKLFLERHLLVEKNNGYGRILKKYLTSVLPSQGKLLPLEQTMVSSFVIDILHRVIPLELFGNKNIRKKFFAGIVKIINGQKEENFLLKDFVLTFIKNKRKFGWLSDINDNDIQNIIITKMLKFFIIHYIFLILRNNFYITETSISGYSLKFFRKGDIDRATNYCINRLLYKKQIKLYESDIFTVERKWIDTGYIHTEDLLRKSKLMMKSGTEFRQPVAIVRFLPKGDGNQQMRMITVIPQLNTKLLNSSDECKKVLELFTKRLESRKKKLFLVKLFLNYLVEKTCSGIDPSPQNLKIKAIWRKAIQLKSNAGKIYFVKTDIADAFNSVTYSKLWKILQAKTRNTCGDTIQLKFIKEWRMRNNQIYRGARLSFSSLPKENSVMIECSVYGENGEKLPNYRTGEFMDIIKQVVMEQRIRIKGKNMMLAQGLAQGSAGKFSSQLCEIYYSSMDELYFETFTTSDDCILIRGVDDYLLITSRFHLANKFLQKVRCGIKDFNAKFNASKLVSNLISDTKTVIYLGLIFDFNNMSVKPDYSKLHTQKSLSLMKLSDASIHFQKNNFFDRKAMFMNTLKLYPILLNKNYSDLQSIKYTVYQACMVHSIRIIDLAEYLYYKNNKNVLFIIKVLNKSCKKLQKKISLHSEMSENEVKLIFWHSVVTVFGKKSGQFKTLLVIMQYYFKKYERECFSYKSKSVNLSDKTSRYNENIKRQMDIFLKPIMSNKKASKFFFCNCTNLL